MALVVADSVKETSTTTGTGTYTLAGAMTGFRSFAAIGNGNTTFYTATDGISWEHGVGTYTYSGTTLARTNILSSSNSNNAVSWSAGTREIYCINPASRSMWNLGAGLITHDGSGTLSVTSIGTSDGNVPVFASGGIDWDDKDLIRPVLRDVAETKQTVAAASTTTIDITSGNVIELTQNTNITSMSFTNPSTSGSFCGITIIRVKDNSGTTRTIAWPSSVDWAGGTAPALTQTANAVDIFVFFTIDGGTRWHGAVASLDSK